MKTSPRRATGLALGLAALAAVLGLAGCATSEKVQARQIGDQEMSCAEIKAANAELDQAERKVDANRGVTGTNVAGALFWLPGLAYTYYDAGQADQLISERRSWLSQLYDQKGCSAAA
jgi:hypothetical protein